MLQFVGEADHLGIFPTETSKPSKNAKLHFTRSLRSNGTNFGDLAFSESESRVVYNSHVLEMVDVRHKRKCRGQKMHYVMGGLG